MFEAPLVVVTADDEDSPPENQAFWLQSTRDARQVILAGGPDIYANDRVIELVLRLVR